jgi:hypothetical protein
MSSCLPDDLEISKARLCNEKSLLEFFSVQPLCALCVCGVFSEQERSTEAQSTQRLHREECMPSFRKPVGLLYIRSHK